MGVTIPVIARLLAKLHRGDIRSTEKWGDYFVLDEE